MTASLPRQARFLEGPYQHCQLMKQAYLQSTLKPCVLFAIARGEAGFARRAQQLIIKKTGKKYGNNTSASREGPNKNTRA